MVVLRAHIAQVIDAGCAARDLVGLSKRLVDLTTEISRLGETTPNNGLRLVEDGPFDETAV